MNTEQPLDQPTSHERARARLAAARTVLFIEPVATPLRTSPLVVVLYIISIASLALAIALPFVM